MRVIIRETVCTHHCPGASSVPASIEDGRVRACEAGSVHPFGRGGLCRNIACATTPPGT